MSKRAHRVLGLVGPARQELRAASRGRSGSRADRRSTRRPACRRRRSSPPRIDWPPTRPRGPRDRTTDRAMPVSPGAPQKYSAARLRPPHHSTSPSAISPFAVIAQIPRTLGPAREQRAEIPPFPTPAACMRLNQRSRQLDCTDAVDEEANPHAALDAADQRAVASSPNASSPEDVRADVQPPIARLHDLEQRAFAPPRRSGACARARAPSRGKPKLSMRSSAQCFALGQAARHGDDPARQLAAAEQQVHRQREIGQRDAAQDPGDGDRRRPPLALRARGEHICEQAQHDGQRVGGDSRKPGIHGGCSLETAQHAGQQIGEVLRQKTRPEVAAAAPCSHTAAAAARTRPCPARAAQDHSAENVARACRRQALAARSS